MRTKFYFVAALAATMLASCADDKFVGDNSPNVVQNESTENAIVFGSGFKAITRADHVGADAANLLNKKFIVGGFKGTATPADNIVFDNYIVNWEENSAGETESNTSDWEYVGITAAAPSTLAGQKQTIKYWDYTDDLYDYVAYSLGNGTATATAFNTTNHSFTITGDEENLKKCYIANRVTVKKADFGKEVMLTFRNLAAKVRVALYETIPGYSVKGVEFYQNNSDGLNVNNSGNTSATLIGTFNTGGTYTVTYPGVTEGEADYNKAHVTLGGTVTSVGVRNTFGALNYTTTKEQNEKTGTDFLKRNSTDPSFAGTTPFYQTVLPNETGTSMELRINYTLEAIDGSGEEIKIYGAKAYVPANYCQWLPNYAYTYIFKISDNTNGWTSKTDTDPAGLYPITFDAVVIDSEENTQTTITTVATPSITTYQKGHDYSAEEEYAAGAEDIYVQVMMGDNLMTNLNEKGQLYTLSVPKTEAEVLDALAIQASTTSTTITGRNGLTLTKATSDATITTIPRADGNNIDLGTEGKAASFDAVAGTYAYVYDTDTYTGAYYESDPGVASADYYSDPKCTTANKVTTWSGATTLYQKDLTYIYSAVKFAKDASTPDDWSGNYWDNPDGTGSAVPTFTSSAFDPTEGQTYYRRYTVNHKVYGVKVIKVVTPTP